MNIQIPREFIVLFNEPDADQARELEAALKSQIDTRLRNSLNGPMTQQVKVEMISIDNDECMVLLDNLGSYKDYDPIKTMLVIFNPSSDDLISGLCISMARAFGQPILYVDQVVCQYIKQMDKPTIHCCDYDGSAETLAIDIVKKSMDIQAEMLGTAVSEPEQQPIHITMDELASTPAD